MMQQKERDVMIYDDMLVDSLVNILHQQGALKGKDISALKRDFKERSDIAFEEFLIEENIVTRAELLKALESYYNVPSLDVIGEMFDHELVAKFPKDVMVRHSFIPYERDGDVLVVVASSPDDPELPEIIGRFVSYDVTFMVGYENDIQDEIDDFVDTPVNAVSMDEDLRAEHLQQEEEEQMTSEQDIGK